MSLDRQVVRMSPANPPRRRVFAARWMDMQFSVPAITIAGCTLRKQVSDMPCG